MSFEITQRARASSEKITKQPNIVLCIEGVDTKYGSASIIELIRVGDPGLIIDGSWVIGGFRALDDQLNAVSLDGSTTSINQQLDIDKGRGSSISSMEIALIDFNEAITELISSGNIVTNILGRKAKVQLGFAENTSYPEDYFTIFRGMIDDVKAEQGIVKLNIAHPDQKKRQRLYEKVEHQLDGSITNVQTTITLDSTTNLLVPITGPDGSIDPSFRAYVRIDDELIRYTGISGNDLTGCTRGQLSSVAASHDDEATVDSFYYLEGNSIDLALKLMLSGWNDSFVENVSITNFRRLPDNTIIENSIFFQGINVEEEYGLVPGDFIKISGAANGANNVATYSEILNVTVEEIGSWLEVDGVTFVDELATSAVCEIRSQYDTLPNGCKMSGDEVDVAEHLRLQQLFLSSFDYRFYLKDTIENASEYIEQQIYKPASAYSLPRKARASLGYFIGPLPGSVTTNINASNVTNPDKLKTRRTINKNFFNTIVYKYEVDPLEEKFLRGVLTQSATSLSQIPVGSRALVVESEGMRQDLAGSNNAQIASNRRIDRFKFGAEFLEGVDVNYESGFTLEIGDILILDGSNLNILDMENATRGAGPRLFEIINRRMNIKNGKITLDLLDTGFDNQGRYALIGPASRIKNGSSQTQFVIEQYFRSIYGTAEYKKWKDFPLVKVKVRSEDGTTRYFQTSVTEFISNSITVNDALGFTPQAADIMELSDYDFTGVTEVIKLRYGHMTPGASATFPSDGEQAYQML